MIKSLFFAAAVALAAQVQAQTPAPAPAPAQVQPQADLRGNWLQADTTRAQALQRADMMFQKLDANRDGVVTRDEAQKAGPQMGNGGARVERLMARLFGDAQSVTQAQFQAQAMSRFDRQDINHDGTVTADERQQARAARQQSSGN